MEMDIIRADDEVTHIEIRGRMGIAGVQDIDAAFQEQIARGKPTLIDMTDVDYMASMGIRLLLAAYKALKQKGLRLLLLRPHTTVESTLEMSGLSVLIAKATGLEAALLEVKQTLPE